MPLLPLMESAAAAADNAVALASEAADAAADAAAKQANILQVSLSVYA